GVDRGGPAELARVPELPPDQIQGDDPPAPGDVGTLDRVEPDPASAEDDDTRARLDPGAIDDGAVPGDDCTAEESRLVERQIVRDLEHCLLRDDRVLRERRHAGEVLDLLSAEREPREAI